jgi:hypothetical protein
LLAIDRPGRPKVCGNQWRASFAENVSAKQRRTSTKLCYII